MTRYLALSLIVIALLLPQAGSPATPPGPASQTLNPAGPAVLTQDHKGGSGDSRGSHPDHPENTTSAQREAWYGEYQLSWGRIDEARDHCKTALNADPANKIAIRCLNEAAKMAVDDQLNQADKLLLQNKPADAAVMAAPVAHSQAPCSDRPCQMHPRQSAPLANH